MRRKSKIIVQQNSHSCHRALCYMATFFKNIVVKDWRGTLVGLFCIGMGSYLLVLCEDCKGEDLYVRLGVIILGMYAFFTNKKQRKKHIDMLVRLAKKKLPAVVGVVLAITIAGCTHAKIKMILRDGKALQAVADTLIKRGICVNDTTYIESRQSDTVQHIDSTLSHIAIRQDLDTTIAGVSIRIVRDTLRITRRDTMREVQTKTVYKAVVRDKSKEDVLAREIAALAQENSKLKGKGNALLWMLIGFALGLALSIFMLVSRAK